MIPTYEQLTSAPKIYLKMWSDLQPGDWVTHDSWVGVFYRVSVGKDSDWYGLDRVLTKVEGIQNYNFDTWVRPNLKVADSRFYKVDMTKDYDPEQQPWEEGDI